MGWDGPRPRFTKGDIAAFIFIGFCASYFIAHIAYAGLS